MLVRRILIFTLSAFLFGCNNNQAGSQSDSSSAKQQTPRTLPSWANQAPRDIDAFWPGFCAAAFLARANLDDFAWLKDPRGEKTYEEYKKLMPKIRAVVERCANRFPQDDRGEDAKACAILDENILQNEYGFYVGLAEGIEFVNSPQEPNTIPRREIASLMCFSEKLH